MGINWPGRPLPKKVYYIHVYIYTGQHEVNKTHQPLYRRNRTHPGQNVAVNVHYRLLNLLYVSEMEQAGQQLSLCGQLNIEP